MSSITKSVFTNLYNKLRPTPIDDVVLQKTDSLLTLTNFPGFSFCEDIHFHWEISNLENGNKLFNSVKSTSITFNRFFLPEVLFILNELSSQKKTTMPLDIIMQAKIALQTEASTLANIHYKKLDTERLKDFNLTPLSHQKPFYYAYDRKFKVKGLNGCFLAGDVGCGKTLMSTSVMHCSDAEAVIVVCPKRSIDDIWVPSLSIPEKSFFHEPQKSWVVGDAKKKFDLTCKYFIFNYEKLETALFLVKALEGKRIGIILDECHKCNEETSKATERFLKVCKEANSENIIWMSATPIKALGTEMIQALKTFDPSFTGDCEERFKKTFTNVDKAAEILSKRFKEMSHLITREEYMETPKPDIKRVDVKLDDPLLSKHFEYDSFMEEASELTKKRLKECISTGGYLEKYAEILRKHEEPLKDEKDIEAFKKYFKILNTILSSGFESVKNAEANFCNRYERTVIAKTMSIEEETIFNDLRKIVKNPASIAADEVMSFFHNRRQECFATIAAQYDYVSHVKNARKKVVVFSEYIVALKAIKEQLSKAGIGYAAVHTDAGQTSEEALHAFRNDDKCRIILTTYKSLSESIPLIEAADMIFVNPPYREYTMKQAIGRCDRLLQDEQIYGFNLILNTGDKLNLSTRTEEIMKWSEEQVNAIIKRDGINRSIEL